MVKEDVLSAGAPQRQRQGNRAAVLDVARRLGAFSRAQLAAATGLSPATVTRLVRSLMADGYLADAGEVRLSGGRPQIMLEYRAEAELVAVVDVHDGMIDASLLDWNGNAHGEPARRRIADFPRDVQTVLDDFVGAVGDRLKAVTVAIPGVTAESDGDIRLAPSIGSPTAPLKSLLERELDLPVVVDNDVNLMVVGEHVAGAATDSDDVLLIHIGETGVGAAMMFGGRVRQGARGFAGEIGFLPFGPPRPPEDELGAFEAEWALSPLRRRSAEGASPHAEALRAWGRAAAAAVCVLDPEVVLISGPDLRADDLSVLADETQQFVPGETDIRLAAIGDRALRVGGARRAFGAHDARAAE